MLTLFPSGLGDLGCCHIPEAWAPCFPRMDCHGADGAGEGVPAPWSRWACSPLPRPTTSRSRRTLLQWNYAYCTQRMWSLWAERALKSPVGSCLLVIGFPPPASFFRVLTFTYESTLPRVVLQELGCVQGIRLGRKKNGTQALSSSSGTFHSDSPGTRLSPRLLFPQ